MADKWHLLFLSAFRETKLPKPLPTPLLLHATQFCKGKIRDVDNGITIVKFGGDALKKYGYILDDGPKYIKTIILDSKKGNQNKTILTIIQTV